MMIKNLGILNIMNDNSELLIYRSRLPIIFYIWIILALTSLAFIIIILKADNNNLTLWAIVSLSLYYILCRKSCIIYVYDDKFKIQYLSLYDAIEFKFDDIVEMDYKKGFYDFRAPIESTYHFKMICFDTLFLELKTGKIKLNINTRLGGFNQLKDTIRKKNIINHKQKEE